MQMRLIDCLGNRQRKQQIMVGVMKLFWHEIVSLGCYPGSGAVFWNGSGKRYGMKSNPISFKPGLRNQGSAILSYSIISKASDFPETPALMNKINPPIARGGATPNRFFTFFSEM